MKRRIFNITVKVVLFISLLFCGIAVGSLAESYNQGYQQSDYLPVKDFYSSKRFAGEMGEWSGQLKHYLKNNILNKSAQDEEEQIKKDEIVYSVVEYQDVVEEFGTVQDSAAITEVQQTTEEKQNKTARSSKREDTEDEDTTVQAPGEEQQVGTDYSVSIRDSLYQNISWSNFKKKDSSAAEQILNGEDSGEEWYFFYNELKNYIQYKRHIEGTKNFLHISGRKLYSLLYKYADDKVPSSDLVLGQFPDVYDTSEDVVGFYNDYNGNLLIYSSTGGESGNGRYSLNTAEQTFTYALKDVGMDKDYYIPLELLDYSSLENLEKAIITTPFTTVENTMAFLGMQEYINQYEELDEYDDWYYQRTLEEVYYEVEYIDSDKKKGIVGNCDEDMLSQADCVIQYSPKDKKFLEETQEMLDDGIILLDEQFTENLDELQNVSMVTIGIKEGIGWNSLGNAIYETFVQEHLEVFMGTAIGAGMLSLLLLILLFCKEPARLYKRDRHYLVTKTVVAGLLGTGVGVVIGGSIEYVFEQQMQFSNFSMLFFLFCGAAILLFLLYIICLEYLLSVIRLWKAKEFKNYVWLNHIWKNRIVKIGDRCKHALEDMWKHQVYAKRSAMLVAGYLLGNLLAGFFIILCFSAAPFLGFLLFLAAVAGNIYIWYRVYLDMKSMDTILDEIQRITDGDLSYQIDSERMNGYKKELAEHVNRIGEGLEKSVAASLRDERLKTELITNVSHDIKTPLTSIINYVDLIKREGVEEEPIRGYVDVLDRKSQRLKQLIEDLVEASKASTGNIELTPVNLDMAELVNQTIGEFEDKFREKNLELITQIEEYSLVIYGDGRRCYRIIENLFQNVYKYAMPQTRVYLSMNHVNGNVEMCIKNISDAPLNINVEELTQRFVRGEESRTTEGSGLGLSIAKSLTQLQKGVFTIELDGDLFKVTVVFPLVEESAQNSQESVSGEKK